MDHAAIFAIGHEYRIISLVAFAILCYEFVLTLPMEVALYWKGRWSLVSFLFFLNRYIVLLSHVPVICEYFLDLSGTRCAKLEVYHELLGVVSQGIVALLLMMRTYALYDRDRRIVVLLATILIIGGVVSLWAIRGTLSCPPSAFGDRCVVLVIPNAQVQHYAIAWGIGLLFDTTVFSLTIARALLPALSWRKGLFFLMLRDGTVYYGILMICYLSNVLNFLFAQPEYRGFLSTLTNVLASVIISRMMLNIRDHDDQASELPYTQPLRSQVSELQFRGERTVNMSQSDPEASSPGS